MADKTIGDLSFAPGTVDDSNTLFVVQQNGTAYKLSGHEFILALTSVLDGHGGISNISYTDPVSPSLKGTLTITLADQSTYSVDIMNGNGIKSFTQYWAVSSSSSTVPSSWQTTRQNMTATNRYLWSYMRITKDDNTYTDTTKSVVGVYGDTGNAWYMHIRYSGSQPTKDSDMGTTPDKWIGIYSGTSQTAPTSYTSYTWYQIKGDTGEGAQLTSSEVVYQEGASGTTPPTGTWSATVPTTTKGTYLWTRTTLTFDTGSPVVFYQVAYQGTDGQGSPSDATPEADGNGAAGTSPQFSRADHVHPANVGSTAPGSDVTGGNAGSSNVYARADHRHVLNAGSTVPDADTAAGSAGSSSVYARADHRHKANAKVASITLSTTWSGTGPFTQTVSLASYYAVTANTKVDLQPDATTIQQLIDDGVSALYVENNNGTITVYAIGAAPTAQLTIQATCMEVQA